MRVQQMDTKQALIVVKGPGATRLLEVTVLLLEESRGMGRHPRSGNTKVKFTIKPAGTVKTSQVTVKITSLSLGASMNPNYYCFEGIASRGVKVWGYYSLSEPNGNFIQDRT